MNSIENILFLDIETVPLVYQYSDLDNETKALWDKKWQYAKDTGPEKQYEKSGIFAEFAKVVCIGLGYYHSGKFRVKCLASKNEKELLIEFSELLNKHFNSSSSLLCAHNGKEFDFPFLCRRFIIQSLPLPRTLNIQGKKPWEINHLDTMEMWKFGDYKNYTSLNLLAHVFKIPSPKDEMDGSMVASAFYEKDALDKIGEYCMKDVITLARVYGRFTNLPYLEEKNIIFV